MNATSLQPDTLHAPTDLEATPPEAPPIEPRTEAFDWLFVRWRRTDAPPARNEPPRDMRVSDAAELERIELGTALPERELEICRQLRAHVKQAALNWEHDAYKDKVDDWLPSAGELAYWLAKERATVAGDAAPPAPSEPAPDPTL